MTAQNPADAAPAAAAIPGDIDIDIAAAVPGLAPWLSWSKAAWDYGVDAWQRNVLLLDILRERGNETAEHEREGMPPVLAFPYETLIDGRTLPEPVNYALLRILPLPGHPTDDTNRPFVVIDPRAGHGPGIGGFKTDSEIGIALRRGHPCYFVTFFQEPCPGQTIEAVTRIEALFLQTIAARHPEAPGKPFIIGNCQAGWATMILASAAPELAGPILLAGAPLAYWSGVRGRNPMRYSGGLLGGSWLASLTADMGNGRFDGAWLVQNFENLNPSNTLWGKLYNVYSKADTEGPRFLEFERWWGGHFLMNKAEIEWIVQNLFVGNKLTAGGVHSADGKTVIDMRSVKTPIIVFASWGDNITPPQQALNWIPDLYPTVDDLVANDQVIVYCLHPSVGHLGIFVSAGVANREHNELFCALDLIDALPPGLYEAKIEDVAPDAPHADLVEGRYLMRFERRTVDDILALDDGREDERAFEVVRRVSEFGQHVYDTFVSPVVRAGSNEVMAQAMREMHPSRLERKVASDLNPWMTWIGSLAPSVREHRQPVAADNPFLTMEHAVSAQITSALDQYRDQRDAWCELAFLCLYESPALAGLMGVQPRQPVHVESPVTVALRKELAARRIEDAEASIEQGTPLDAFLRVIGYVANQSDIEERPFNLMRKMAREAPEAQQLNLATFKAAVRKQSLIMRLDPDRAIAALPLLVPDMTLRRRLMMAAHRVLTVSAPLAGEYLTRYREVAAAIGTDHTPATAAEIEAEQGQALAGDGESESSQSRRAAAKAATAHGKATPPAARRPRA